MNKSTRSICFSLALALMFFVAGHVAYAVSFNCNKAQTQVEKMICADPTLSADDDQLAKLFKIPKEEHLGHDDPIYVVQRAWLKNIRNVCTTTDCLHTAYQKRIGYLKNGYFGSGAQCDLSSPIAAKSGCKIISACAENADYSFLQAVSSRCENAKVNDTQTPNKRDVMVYYYQSKGAQPLLLKPLQVEVGADENEITWGALDRNGFAELSVQKFCGRRDCISAYFRFDPEKREMYDFYEGIDHHFFDGHLVSIVKSGCCSSEVQAYKVHQEGLRDVVENKTLVISAEMEDETHGETCSVSETYGKDDSQYRPAKLPNKKWLSYCPSSEYNK